MKTNELGSLPDLVGRAAALLAQQKPAVPALPTLPRMPPSSTPAPIPVEELRQRALDLVSAFFASAGQPPPQPLTAASALVPWLRSPPIAAGQTLAVPLTIENDQDRPAEVYLYSTDLLSDQGHSIPGHLVSFEPPSLTLAPGGKSTVQANVAVPLQSVPGAYSGLVQTHGLPGAKKVLTVEVT